LSSCPVGKFVVVVDLERSSLFQEFGESLSSNSVIRSDEVSENGSDGLAGFFELTSVDVGGAVIDLVPSFLSIDDKASSNSVDDGSWIFELGNSIKQSLRLVVSNTAFPNGGWEAVKGLSEEGES
jgi:hypothetical protein